VVRESAGPQLRLFTSQEDSARAAQISDPVAWTGTLASGAVARVGELASIEGKTATTDTSREAGPQALKLGHALVDAPSPTARQLGPIGAFRNAVLRQLRQFCANLFEGQANLLRKNNESDTTYHGPRVPAMAGTVAFGVD
jgi:hypothetical protein